MRNDKGDTITLEDLATEDQQRAADISRRKAVRRWRRGEC